MDARSSSEESDSFDWNSEDELEIKNSPLVPSREPITGSEEANSSNSKLIHHFVGMGFSERMVVKVIDETGEDNVDTILDNLLTQSALDFFPQEIQCGYADPLSPESKCNFVDDLSDVDSCPGNEENTDCVSGKDEMLSFLVDMGYEIEEASIAIERCGTDALITDLTDYICAAQLAKEADAHPRQSTDEDEMRDEYCPREKKRKFNNDDIWKSKGCKGCEKKQMDEDEEILHLPNPMIGFGVPGEPWSIARRTLLGAAVGPPYFYYENVALTPKGVWSKIARFLYDIEPEFVDSKYFCAAARKRGYVHNLPIHDRSPLLPTPPGTIHEALPLTQKWWPSWDLRMKLNCLQTVVASAKVTERIRKALQNCDDEPPPNVQKYVVEQCRKWNLVWVGRNKVAPLEPHEMEMLLGFPRDHTRGGGISRTERYKALGNSFQVDTVAYHLSVLKNLFPNGINLLSLFSGIGGAEVALHRLAIPLKNVVSVEISESNRNILRCWWDQTNQQGKLIEVEDVQQVTADMVAQWIASFGGFDLVIGGSPCNNLSGSNRVSRDGLEGQHSSLFFEYFRILDLVKSMTGSC